MKRTNTYLRAAISLWILGLWNGAGFAVLPQPDAILYGSVTVNEQLVTGGMTVIARVDGIEEPVGTYIYGGCLSSGTSANCPPSNRYLMRIRMESLADDSMQSPSLDAAEVGQTVKVYLLPEGGEESLATAVELSSRGLVRQLDLEPMGMVDENALFEASKDWYGDTDPLLPSGLLDLIDMFQNQ